MVQQLACICEMLQISLCKILQPAHVIELVSLIHLHHLLICQLQLVSVLLLDSCLFTLNYHHIIIHIFTIRISLDALIIAVR